MDSLWFCSSWMTHLYAHVIRLLCPHRTDCILWTSFLLFMQICQHLKHFIIGLCVVIHYDRKTKQVVWREWSEQSSSSCYSPSLPPVTSLKTSTAIYSLHICSETWSARCFFSPVVCPTTSHADCGCRSCRDGFCHSSSPPAVTMTLFSPLSWSVVVSLLTPLPTVTR